VTASLEVRLPEMILPNAGKCRIQAGGFWGRAGQPLSVRPGRVCVSVHVEGSRGRASFRLIFQFEIAVAPGSMTIVELPSRQVVRGLWRKGGPVTGFTSANIAPDSQKSS
jgi:hypothetical protein